MKKYDFDLPVPRRESDCVKYDICEEVFGSREVIPLWVADMDFAVAPCIERALRQRLDHPVYGYGIRPKSWFEAVCGWVWRRNGWETQPEWIGFVPGVVPGFVLAIRALSDEGDGVVIQPPVYPPFAQTIRANGRRIVENPMRLTDGGFEIDFDDLDRKLAEAKLLLFCNPHNPTGRVFTRAELERVGELCLKHDVLIVSDEIHSDLIHKPHRHIHIASLLPELAARTVTLIAPSKTFNIAGLSTGVSITPHDSLRRRLCAESDKIHIEQGNVFGTVALEAAYNGGEEWLEALLEYIAGNIRYVGDFLETELPAVKAIRPEGTYLMWLDMRGLGMEHERLARFLVEKAGIGLNDGAAFGEQGRGFMRINLATSRSVIEQALKQLCDAVASR